jgi:membrane protease YdiL (CAAX protease family)
LVTVCGSEKDKRRYRQRKAERVGPGQSFVREPPGRVLTRGHHFGRNRERINVTADMRSLRSKLIPFVAVVVLILVTTYLPLLAFWGKYRGGVLRYLVPVESWLSSLWMNPELLVTLAVIVIARWWEKDPWSSVGISRPSLADPFLGVAAFLAYMDYSYIENSILRDWIATNFSSLHRANPTLSIALSLLAVTATGVLFEELTTRAYVIERVIGFTGNRWVAGFASVLVSLAIHLPGRTLGEMLRVTPIILLMTMLYIWRRNIVPAFIAHFAGNSVSVLIFYPMRHLVLWLVLPSRNWIVVLPVAALYLALHRVFERPSLLRRG